MIRSVAVITLRGKDAKTAAQDARTNIEYEGYDCSIEVEYEEEDVNEVDSDGSGTNNDEQDDGA